MVLGANCTGATGSKATCSPAKCYQLKVTPISRHHPYPNRTITQFSSTRPSSSSFQSHRPPTRCITKPYFKSLPPPLRISTPYSTFTTTPIAIRTFPFYIPIASNSFIPTSYIQSYSPPPISTLNTSYFHKHPRPPISTLNTPYFTLTPIPYFHSKHPLNPLLPDTPYIHSKHPLYSLSPPYCIGFDHVLSPRVCFSPAGCSRRILPAPCHPVCPSSVHPSSFRPSSGFHCLLLPSLSPVPAQSIYLTYKLLSTLTVNDTFSRFFDEYSRTPMETNNFLK